MIGVQLEANGFKRLYYDIDGDVQLGSNQLRGLGGSEGFEELKLTLQLGKPIIRFQEEHVSIECAGTNCQLDKNTVTSPVLVTADTSHQMLIGEFELTLKVLIF